MSEAMMLSIAKMPYEMAMMDEISRRQFYANTQRLVSALEAAQMGLRHAVRVWVLSDEIAWSDVEIDKVVEDIIRTQERNLGMNEFKWRDEGRLDSCMHAYEYEEALREIAAEEEKVRG